MLYVFDPLALQQVLTKDGVYYEQPSFAYSFVVHADYSIKYADNTSSIEPTWSCSGLEFCLYEVRAYSLVWQSSS